jgi:hypothetical protein
VLWAGGSLWAAALGILVFTSSHTHTNKNEPPTTHPDHQVRRLRECGPPPAARVQELEKLDNKAAVFLFLIKKKKKEKEKEKDVVGEKEKACTGDRGGWSCGGRAGTLMQKKSRNEKGKNVVKKRKPKSKQRELKKKKKKKKDKQRKAAAAKSEVFCPSLSLPLSLSFCFISFPFLSFGQVFCMWVHRMPRPARLTSIRSSSVITNNFVVRDPIWRSRPNLTILMEGTTARRRNHQSLHA